MPVGIKTPPVKYDVFKLQGGLDLITPTLSLSPGVARLSLNFEVSTTGGYSRIAGYERFDGRPSPSAATYFIFNAIDYNALSTPILSAATNGQPDAAIFKEYFNGRMLGDLNNSGTVSSADSLAAIRYQAKILTDIAQINYIAGFFTTTLLSDKVKYKAYLDPTATALPVGSTITGATSGATAVVLSVNAGQVLCTKVSGTFVAQEALQIGGVTKACVASLFPTTSPTTYQQAQYSAYAADAYRADIQAVPGSGSILGVAYLNNTVYAWRNNAGGTATNIYKSTGAGWTSVALGYELGFNTGAGTAIAEGNTVTGLTSGATGVVSRVVLQSGSTWIGGSGRLILSSTTGTFTAAEALQVSGTTRANATGAAAAITLLPNGRVETVTANLGGSLGATRLYGVDKVNRGFEFDGTVYVPIRTGMVDDTPDHVAVQKNYLFFSFGPSVQNSSVGAPYVWSPLLGTNELVLPEDVTCMQSMPGDASTAALAIYTKNNTHVLYGVSSSAWNLVPYDRGTGAAAYTTQTITDAYSLDDRGVMSLATTRSFGNFDSATLTFAIRPFIQARRGLAVASGVNREKSQYRVFYSDGYALYVTVANGKLMGSMPIYFPNPVTCWCEGETGSGAEVSYFGSTNGYVYKMDTGPDFDSVGIEANFTLNFNPEGSPRVLKRYRRASLETTSTGFAQFDFGYSLAYESGEIDQAGTTTYQQPLTSAVWDTFVWDQFTWDDRKLAPIEIQCDGTGENIAIAVRSASRYDQPYTINSATLHYSFRRGIR